MPRKSFEDNNISRGINFLKICEKLFPGDSRRLIGAKLGGVSEGSVRNWETGSTIPNRVLGDLDRRGVSLTWLLTSEGEMFKEGVVSPIREGQSLISVKEATLASQAPKKQMSLPPVIEIPPPKGSKIIASRNEMPVRGLAAADDSGGTRVPDTDDLLEPIRFPSGLMGIPVVGDSMSPVVLGGQYVEIDVEREGFERNDGIYVISVLEPEMDDDYPEPITGTFVKRCERQENLYYLKSINSYSPFSVHVDHCRIWPVLGIWFADRGAPPEGF